MNIPWKPGIVALISLLAIASVSSGSGTGAADASQPGNRLALQSAAIDQTICNPRDPLSPCSPDPRFGYPAGDLFIVEHFFGEG
jgi:hypothetical protein